MAAPRGTHPSGAQDFARCPCGSTWYEIAPCVGAGGAEIGIGAVSLSVDGEIVAYSGVPACIECGEPWVAGSTTAGSTVAGSTVVDLAEEPGIGRVLTFPGSPG